MDIGLHTGKDEIPVGIPYLSIVNRMEFCDVLFRRTQLFAQTELSGQNNTDVTDGLFITDYVSVKFFLIIWKLPSDLSRTWIQEHAYPTDIRYNIILQYRYKCQIHDKLCSSNFHEKESRPIYG